MLRNINIKSLGLLLSKYLFFVIIPISLIGMMPAGPARIADDPYIVEYDNYINRYNAANEGIVHNMNTGIDGLWAVMNSMIASANDSRAWAENRIAFAEVTSCIASLIRDRISVILGLILDTNIEVQVRSAIVKNHIAGSELFQADLPIIGHIDRSKHFNQQAGRHITVIEESLNLIINRMRRIDNVIVGMVVPERPDRDEYNFNRFRNCYNAVGKMSRDYEYIRNYTVEITNHVERISAEYQTIRNWMNQIVQEAEALGIPLPTW